MKKKLEARITVRLDDDMYARLLAYMENEGLTKESDIMRSALKKFLDSKTVTTTENLISKDLANLIQAEKKIVQKTKGKRETVL